MTHEDFMRKALQLARDGLGRTWPNPSVGCVIVKNGKIISQARTADSGRPHAETIALEKANAKDTTVYVTLEPCAHHGKTPPCAEALVRVGVAEVVIGCIDPDKRVSGKGIKILEDAGIKVTACVLEKECIELNKGFFKTTTTGLPYTMLKAAISHDGKYLTGNNSPRWVTGKEARNEVHRLRSQYDAIMTGTGTVLADNPQLDIRLPGLENRSPIKIIIGKSKIAEEANIFKGKETWLYPQLDMKDIGKRGITRLMIEAGPTLSNVLLKADLVDEVTIFQSPENLGNKGKDFFSEHTLDKFKKISEEKIGDDLKITLTAKT